MKRELSDSKTVSRYRITSKIGEQARKTYDVDPNFRFVHQWLGQAYIANGRYDEAIGFAEKVL